MRSRRTCWPACATSATGARAGRPPRCRPPTTRSRGSRPPSRETSTTDRAAAAPSASFRLVGGKGGVGKTTCAAAMAVAAARDGARTLVVSTDPASSLGDAFGRRLTPAPTPIPIARASLHAVEIDAARALDAWIAARRDRLERIALRGTWLDREDVTRLLRLSLPGIDEIAALFELARFGRSRRFDVVVVDTAPTGHTLRLLGMPDALRRVARVFDHLQEQHRLVATALTGRWRPDEEDALIEELDREGRDLAALLRDPSRLWTSWVTLAEPMAVEETLDAVGHLAAEGIPVAEVIFNRLTPPPATPCRRCTAQRAVEGIAIARVVAAMPGTRLAGVRERGREPAGVPALSGIGRELRGRFDVPRRTARRARSWTARAAPAGRGRPADVVDASMRLVLFGGKGGVGKTTCAAAAALDVAARAPRRRVLLLSTDPAHSLADALGAPLSDRAQTVRGAPCNLDVRELDAIAGYGELRERYARALDALFERIARGTSIDTHHDRLVLQDLLDLAPPGIDELIAVAEVVDALDGAYDLVVMDTAPTGHALRLLDTPALVQDWARALMAIVIKYQAVIGVGTLGELLLNLSRGIGRLRALLGDPLRTQFIAVTRAAALPREETLRLLAQLGRMGIAAPLVIVNATGRGTCALCRRVASAEVRETAALRRSLRDRAAAVLIAPAAVPPPHGPAELTRWRATWRGSAP